MLSCLRCGSQLSSIDKIAASKMFRATFTGKWVNLIVELRAKTAFKPFLLSSFTLNDKKNDVLLTDPHGQYWSCLKFGSYQINVLLSKKSVAYHHKIQY